MARWRSKVISAEGIVRSQVREVRCRGKFILSSIEREYTGGSSKEPGAGDQVARGAAINR
jgi:hypothetical protein